MPTLIGELICNGRPGLADKSKSLCGPDVVQDA